MITYCLDTNYLLRYIIEDVSEQVDEVVKLFEECAEGNARCFVSIVVQMECFYVLSTFYDFDKQKVCDIMSNIYDMSFIRFDQLSIMRRAMEIHLTSSLSIQDAYMVSLSLERGYGFKSFDKKAINVFDKLVAEG
jgi:predicted nucleic acid-binding protein